MHAVLQQANLSSRNGCAPILEVEIEVDEDFVAAWIAAVKKNPRGIHRGQQTYGIPTAKQLAEILSKEA